MLWTTTTILTSAIAIAAIALTMAATVATRVARLGGLFDFFLVGRTASQPTHQALEQARR